MIPASAAHAARQRRVCGYAVKRRPEQRRKVSVLQRALAMAGLSLHTPFAFYAAANLKALPS